MNQFDTVFTLKNLIATRDQLADSVEEARTEMARLKLKISTMEERLQLVSRLIEVETRVESDDDVSTPRRSLTSDLELSSPRSQEDELEVEVERILEASGKPLHISEIRSELLKNGVSIPGRGDDANIIVRLRKDGTRFTRTARGTYGLPKWGIPTIDRPKSSRSKGHK